MFWRKCFNSLDELIHNSGWELGEGKVHLWYSNFCGLGCLENPIYNPLPWVDFTVKEGKDFDLDIPVISKNIQEDLKQICSHKVKLVEGKPDKRRWNHTSKGDFYVASAYQVFRTHGQKRKIYKGIWKAFIPTKITLFVWKVLHGAAPLDSNIRSLGIPIVSKCYCCSTNNSCEDSNHLFLKSDLAKAILFFFDFWGGYEKDYQGRRPD